jgi:hypothetical protein
LIVHSRLRPAILSTALLFLAGCAGGGNSTVTLPTSPTPSPQPAEATIVYVPEIASETFGNGPNTPPTAIVSTIAEFPANAGGAVSPLSTLTSLNTTDEFTGIATDSTGNLYVGSVALNTTVGKIMVFAPGATGSAVPVRTITGSATQLAAPFFVAVDTSGNVYATSNGSILEFGAGASGNAAPIRTITGLGAPAGLAVDPSGNIVYAVNSNAGTDSVVVFTPAQSGNATPVRTISAAATSVDIEQIGGLALDTSGNIYIDTQKYRGTGQHEILFEFNAGTVNGSGGRSISGDGSLAGTYLSSTAVDAAGVWYTLVSDGLGNGYIYKFFPGDKGLATPVEESSHLLSSSFGPIAVH